MGRIKKESIDKVFEVSDLVEVISDFMELKKSGANYVGLSPITEERTPSFMVNPVKGIWKCFSSGIGGNTAVSFLDKVRKMDYREAVQYVANKYNISLEFEDGSVSKAKRNEPIIHPTRKPIVYDYHSNDLVKEYGRGFKGNNLIQYLKRFFAPESIKRAITEYCLGTSTHRPGATIFWYLNHEAKVTYGKVVQYDRSSGSSKNAERKVICIRSMSYLLGKEVFNKRPALFGEHLINQGNNYYGIVESEKTAFIMSMIDRRLIWLASGGTGNLSTDLLEPLGNSNVILFPDAMGKNNEAFEKWNEIADRACKMGYNVSCSSMLNDLYGHHGNGYDLADHYLRGFGATKSKAMVKKVEPEPARRSDVILSPDEIVCNKLMERNGAFKNLLEDFDLLTADGTRPRILV